MSVAWAAEQKEQEAFLFRGYVEGAALRAMAAEQVRRRKSQPLIYCNDL